jgi:AcrR family transcriptional regulator
MAMTAESKTLRSDARRNRDQIVAAARDLFAQGGVEIPVEEVTRRAGVGVGTLYRHFPTKEELIDAVLDEAFDEYVALAESALAEADGWTGLCAFLERALELQAGNLALMDVVATREHGRTRAATMRRRMRPLIVRIVERAQQQGSLRADFSPEDVPLLLWGGYGILERGGGVAPEVWRRYLGFVVDGLRQDAATPLAHRPLTRSQSDRARKLTR